MSQRLAFDLAWPQNEHSSMPGQLDRALREDGFVQLTCPAFDWSLANTVFDEAAWFFDQDLAFKQAFAYRSATENFGCQDLAMKRSTLHRVLQTEKKPSQCGVAEACAASLLALRNF